MLLTKKLALVAAMTAAFVGSAHADDEITYFNLVNIYADTVGTTAQYYPLDQSVDFFGNAVPPKLSGDTFDDVYYLSVYDAQDFRLSVGDVTGLSLDGVAVFDAGTFSVPYFFNTYALTDSSFLGTGLSLASGAYAVDVYGSIDADGASYSGLLDNGVTAPVPEPGEWGMLMAGLGAVGVFCRRRSNRPA